MKNTSNGGEARRHSDAVLAAVLNAYEAELGDDGRAAAPARKNFMIGGKVSAGKTTFLRAHAMEMNAAAGRPYDACAGVVDAPTAPGGDA